jgi:hypothetical protein
MSTLDAWTCHPTAAADTSSAMRPSCWDHRGACLPTFLHGMSAQHKLGRISLTVRLRNGQLFPGLPRQPLFLLAPEVVQRGPAR